MISEIKIYCFFLVAFCFVSKSFAQINGCTDANANNYNPAATINDGSCTYPVTNYTPQHLANLSDTIKECSGILLFDNYLWTHNDGENTNQIFEIDSVNGNILKTITITNAVNIDWESITQSDSAVYIGDFGNNYGNRKDLVILKINKAEIKNNINDSIKAEKIYFNYADQSIFDTALNSSNFDCEAFIFLNDSLHLFTKNWQNLKTNHYVLPAKPGNFTARFVDSFDIDGLITDASYNEKTKNIVLVGYKNIGFNFYTCFTWLLFDYKNNNFFSGNKRRIELGNALQNGQTEGVFLKENNKGFIASESINNQIVSIPAQLFSFNFDNFYSAKTVSINKKLPRDVTEINVFPNPFSNQIYIYFVANSFDNYLIYNILGEKILCGKLRGTWEIIHTEKLKNGIYFLTLTGENMQTIKLIKY